MNSATYTQRLPPRRWRKRSFALAWTLLTTQGCDSARSDTGHGRPFAQRAFTEVRKIPIDPLPLDDPEKETHLGPEALRPLDEVVVEFPKSSQEFAMRRPSSDRVLMKAPFLRLAGGSPAGKHHVFVSTNPAEADADTPSAQLVDLRTGPVLDVAHVKEVYPALELAEVQLIRDGRPQLTLLHMQDLHEVPFGVAASGNADLVVNPGLGDAWIFAFDIHFPPHAKAIYAHWTDLRAPPPVPDRELPFQPWSGIRDVEGGWYGDYVTSHPGHEFPLLLVVRNAFQQVPCSSAQMLPDGSYRCFARTKFLGDGWRVTSRRGALVFANDETRELQWLDLLEHCGEFDHFVRDTRAEDQDFTPYPPRLLFTCAKQENEILWSPGTLETVDWGEWGPEERTVNQWLLTNAIKDRSPDGRGSPTQYLDLAHRKLFRTPPTIQYNPFEAGKTIILAPRSQPRSMWVLDLETNAARLVFDAPECDYLESSYGDGRWWAVWCLDREDRVLWSEVFDAVAGTRWRLPATDGSVRQGRLWVSPAARVAIGVVRRGKEDELHVWQLD